MTAAGLNNVPANAAGVIVNTTGVNATEAVNVSMYPAGAKPSPLQQVEDQQLNRGGSQQRRPRLADIRACNAPKSVRPSVAWCSCTTKVAPRPSCTSPVVHDRVAGPRHRLRRTAGISFGAIVVQAHPLVLPQPVGAAASGFRRAPSLADRDRISLATCAFRRVLVADREARVDDFDGWVRVSYARAYRTACLLLANPADAEEAVQEAFLRVWRFRGALPDGDGRQAWLYRVVVNTCRSRQRADAARPRTGHQLDPDLPVPGDLGPEEQLVRAADVQAALAGLPEHLRVVVILHYFVGLLDREIAVAVGRGPGTVRSRLAQARRQLAAEPRLGSWAPAGAGDAS